MSDLIERLANEARSLEQSAWSGDQEAAIMIREAIVEMTELLDASQSIMNWLGDMRCLWDDDAKRRIARLSIAINRARNQSKRGDQ